MQRAPRKVWFLVVPGSESLDVSGPWEVLSHANDLLGRVAYELELVGPLGPTVRTHHGLHIGPVRALPRTTRRPPDIAIVAGGSPRTPLPLPEQRLSRW